MTHTDQTVAKPLERGDWLYDFIMGSLEPELTLDNMPLLDEKYASESEADKAKRMQHYEQVFTEFDRALQIVNDEAVKLAHERKQEVHAKALADEADEHEAEVDAAEEALDSLDSDA